MTTAEVQRLNVAMDSIKPEETEKNASSFKSPYFCLEDLRMDPNGRQYAVMASFVGILKAMEGKVVGSVKWVNEVTDENPDGRIGFFRVRFTDAPGAPPL